MMKNMQVTANKLYVSATQKLFYCNFKIKIPNEAKASLLLKECFDLLHKIDQRYNSYQPGSFFLADKQKRRHIGSGRFLVY